MLDKSGGRLEDAEAQGTAVVATFVSRRIDMAVPGYFTLEALSAECQNRRPELEKDWVTYVQVG